MNLAPWRQEYQKLIKKRFLQYALGIIGIFMVLFWLWIILLNHAIDKQEQSIQWLKNILEEKKQKVKEIEQLKIRQQFIIDQHKILEELQNDRISVLNFFNELADILPLGTYLTHIERTGQRIVLLGCTPKHYMISHSLGFLEKKSWATDAKLDALDHISKTHCLYDYAFKIIFFLPLHRK